MQTYVLQHILESNSHMRSCFRNISEKLNEKNQKTEKTNTGNDYINMVNNGVVRGKVGVVRGKKIKAYTCCNKNHKGTMYKQVP